MDNKNNYMQLLSIGHYVLGGLLILISVLCLIFMPMCPCKNMCMGNQPGCDMAKLGGTGCDMAKLGGAGCDMTKMCGTGCMVILVLVWILAICMIIAGRNLHKGTHKTYCTVIAFIECLLPPLGIVLGVFTLIILYKE
jgi:hypothetical protein